MYIQWVYDINEDGTLSPPDTERGVLISAGEVRTIEFRLNSPQEEAHEQE